MNFAELAPHFSDEDKAIELIERLMWPEGAVCPHCRETEKQYRLTGKTTRKGLWKCGACRKQYTVKVGTIFEDSHIPLTKWLMVIYMMCSSKKGISAKQVQRSIGVSYKSAWHLCHRIRLAMTREPLAGLLGGPGRIVEVDETYIGGKAGNNRRRRKPTKKMIVMTLIDREGEARTFHVPNARKGIMQSVVAPNVNGQATIVTDEHMSYTGLHKRFAGHLTIDHSKTFVRGLIIHTNFAESYHSLLKRAILGTHHHISEHHLSRYLREREFHWNRRKASDGDRLVDAIKGAKGKRLLYRSPTGRRSSLILSN